MAGQEGGAQTEPSVWVKVYFAKYKVSKLLKKEIKKLEKQMM